MPQRLQNVITSKGGHARYWLYEYMYSIRDALRGEFPVLQRLLQDIFIRIVLAIQS